MRDPSSPSTQVHLEIEGKTARVIFSGPKGIQTLGASTRKELNDCLDVIEANNEIRVVIFQGTGRTFIAGADIHEFLDLTSEEGEAIVKQGQNLMSRIASLKPITIAALNGACAGGGFELALVCDFRIANGKAKIGLPETTLGLLPCWGGTVRTTLLFGSSVASRLILTGELLEAEQACNLGIIHECCSPEFFEERIDCWCDLLLSRGPIAVEEAKKLIQKTEKTVSQVELGLSAELNVFLKILHSGELQKGALAFLEKVKPIW